MGRNELEPPGISWNKLKQSRTGWNQLEQAETRWNYQRLALEKVRVVSCSGNC